MDRAKNYQFTRAIDFSKRVNNVCFFVADIDAYKGITIKAKDAKGANLYSKNFPASLKKDAALVTFDLSKIEGIKGLELVGNDP
ncbi:MAG: hypothetical protein O4752_09340, partial [Trichodesmium sp. St4_bin8_1]|nr:hypothetical protein [Trichodesmium sp. St4_bin8_1]